MTPTAHYELVIASRVQLERAAQLMPGVCVEEEVGRAISEGRVRKTSKNPPVLSVWLPGADVRVERDRSPLGRRCWRIVNVRPRQNGQRS